MIRALLLSLAFPIAAQPFIGPERLISTYGTAVPRTASRVGTSAGGNGDGFYVAWTEYTNRDRVIGARLSRDGKLIGMPQLVGDGGRVLEYIRRLARDQSTQRSPRAAAPLRREWFRHRRGAGAGCVRQCLSERAVDPLTLQLARGEVLSVSLTPTPHGVTLAYAHADENAGGVYRAFLLPIAFEPPKPRAVRH